MQTVLIVESNRHQRMLYRMELEEAGCRIVEAKNEGEALRAVKEERPDLLVLAPHLGPNPQDAEGLEVLLKIKETDRTIPVVIFTACTLYDEPDSRYWLADAHVLKSSNLEPLKEAISGLLNLQGESVKSTCSRTYSVYR